MVTTILIESRGGLIDAVYSEKAKDLQVILLDWDELEGAEAGEKTAVLVAEIEVALPGKVPAETTRILKKYWNQRKRHERR